MISLPVRYVFVSVMYTMCVMVGMALDRKVADGYVSYLVCFGCTNSKKREVIIYLCYSFLEFFLSNSYRNNRLHAVKDKVMRYGLIHF